HALPVERAQTGVGQPQAHPPILAFDPDATALQVRHESPLRLVVRVGNIVAHHRCLTGNLTDSSHRSLQRLNSKKALNDSGKRPLLQGKARYAEGRFSASWSSSA